ncbi:LytTR family DNA-binding domain-containing protein [Actinomyces sp. MRS3W]|uniref:LytR/AlgR family response regulator transcription factor n=1 Tax=Actinomyces sp. MRS3W TaxID=2800796 RepID=UPI0028FDA866|nr:LytTR family DNA-binding domain-containing protein [Actinomyces sp. MRS3W]MDU0349509.1 LytTR family DNA-binding domain-containing protein [Actinomyces sp. MRS3W]
MISDIPPPPTEKRSAPMIRVGVVEDDARHRHVLVDYLDRFSGENNLTLKVHTFEDGAELLEDFRPVYDLLLLDIRMQGADGLATARAVRAVDSDVVIIFITSAQQYAINGYEVSALGYLLKPFPYTSFAREMNRARTVLERRDRAAITVKNGADVQRVPVGDIVYLESVGHRVDMHLLDRVISQASTLKDLEPRLAPHGFFRSNSCYIVNLKHVVGVREQDSVMSTGEALRISRPRRKGFMQALTEHISGTRQ